MFACANTNVASIIGASIGNNTFSNTRRNSHCSAKKSSQGTRIVNTISLISRKPHYAGARGAPPSYDYVALSEFIVNGTATVIRHKTVYVTTRETAMRIAATINSLPE